MKDALFVGWFGLIGVTLLFYAMLAMRHTEHREVWVLGNLLICASLIIHSVTTAPFTRMYGRSNR